MRSLRNELPSSDGILYVFYDFGTTQNTRYSDKATVHFPNLICLNSFILNVRTRKILKEIAHSVARENIRSGMILSETLFVRIATLGQQDNRGRA
jgi:hypothetical protein